MNVEKPILVDTFIVPNQIDAIRLSDLDPNLFRQINSKKALKNALKKGLIKMNGKPAYSADYIIGGETIYLYQDHQQKKPEINLKLEIIFEDDYLAIINKPAGIVVSGNKKWTLENALPGNLEKSTHPDALVRPEPIHRLDYPTSGVLLVGKTAKAVQTLNRLFEERKIKKTYLAVCIGSMNNVGVIETEIGNKSAKSEYKVLSKVPSEKYNFLNLVELKPYTGRQHQLRIHMAGIGNPILGDLKYGKEGLILKGKGLYLHSLSLKFIHPLTGKELYVQAKYPKKFIKLFP